MGKNWTLEMSVHKSFLSDHVNRNRPKYILLLLGPFDWNFTFLFALKSYRAGVTNEFASLFSKNSRWSGDVISRTGKKNFNAVSHNRARP